MTDFQELFLQSTGAYGDKNIDKMMSYVAEDYAWFNISEDGATKIASGRDQAAQGIKMVFESENYISGRVDFSKAFGKIVVALEVDTLIEDGKEVEKSRLSVYAFENEKLHRTWSFPVDNED